MYLTLDADGERSLEVSSEKFAFFWVWTEVTIELKKEAVKRPYLSKVSTPCCAGLTLRETEIRIGKLRLFFQIPTTKQPIKGSTTKKYIELSLFKKTNKIV